jgi:hypothetical protein
MPNPIIRIHDLETNKVEDREMTDAEYVDYLAAVDAALVKKNAETAKETQRQEILARLGITAEEAKLLVG